LPEKGNSGGFRNVARLQEIGSGQSPPPQKRKLCQFFVLVSLFWISWPLKLRSIGGHKMLVWNYHSSLRNISEECRSHMIWWCRTWFGSTWSGSEWFGVAQSSLVLHTRI